MAETDQEARNRLIAEEQKRQANRGAQVRAGSGFKESPFDPAAKREAPAGGGWPVSTEE